jgi:hypothetical protein
MWQLSSCPRSNLPVAATLPNPFDPVPVEHYIIAHNRQILRQRLRNQHAVERILVRSRQQAGSNAVPGALPPESQTAPAQDTL